MSRPVRGIRYAVGHVVRFSVPGNRRGLARVTIEGTVIRVFSNGTYQIESDGLTHTVRQGDIRGRVKNR